jgi:hypothetical protein
LTTTKEEEDKVRGGGGRRRQLNTESLYQALLQLYGGQKPSSSSFSGSNVKVALKKPKPSPPTPSKPTPPKPTNIIKPLPTKPTSPKPIVTNIRPKPEQGCADKCDGLEWYQQRGYTCYEVIGRYVYVYIHFVAMTTTLGLPLSLSLTHIFSLSLFPPNFSPPFSFSFLVGSCYGFRWQCRRGLRADAAENDPKDKNDNSMVVGSIVVSKSKDGNEKEEEEEGYRNHQDDEEEVDDHSFFCDQAKAAAAAALSALGDTTIDHHDDGTGVLTNECRAALSTHYDHLEITTCASSSSSSSSL